MPTLQFGQNAQLELPLTADRCQAIPQAPDGPPEEDLVAAVQAALDNPREFPALSQAILPDDHVAIAVAPQLVAAPEVLAGVVRAVIAAGPPAELIRIVRLDTDHGLTDHQLLSAMDADLRARLEVIRHDPSDREQLAFLGPDVRGEGVYVNRVLAEAEFVLPICNAPTPSITNDSPAQSVWPHVHASWYPAFSDQETQQRFRAAAVGTNQSKREESLASLREVAMMLGVQLMVQLLPAGQDRVQAVWAGLPEALDITVRREVPQQWSRSVPQRVPLVVAGVSGGASQQCWGNVVQAIEAAVAVVEPDGCVAVCSQLKQKPPAGLRRLAQAEDYESAEQAIRRKPLADDAQLALRLNRALQQARVYLLSELPEQVVEDMGMAYVAADEEVGRLAAGFDRCLLVPHAQHVCLELESGDA